MLTAQDIQEKAFEKASRGYNMDQVDEFLDELAAEISSLNAENAALKGKLKVLVQKVDEYRQTEDSMRLALLSAQKLSSQIETEAKQRADALVADAQQQADRLTQESAEGIANEQAKLEEAKKATDRFFDHMRTVCQKQIEFYDKLSQMHLVGGSEQQPAETPAAEAQPAAEDEPESEEARPVRPPEISRAARRAAEEAAEAEAAPEPAPEPEPGPAEEAEPMEEEEPTRLFPASQQQPKKKKRSFDDFSFGDDI